MNYKIVYLSITETFFQFFLTSCPPPFPICFVILVDQTSSCQDQQLSTKDSFFLTIKDIVYLFALSLNGIQHYLFSQIQILFKDSHENNERNAESTPLLSCYSNCSKSQKMYFHHNTGWNSEQHGY